MTADGTAFRGRSVGAPGCAAGEVVFNTAMAGYQEVVTDPSYAGQVVVLTASHIGNYGVAAADDQAPAPRCAGLVMRAMSTRVSNWRAQGSLGDHLRSHGIVALSDVDTRRLTRLVRERGAMGVALGVDMDQSELAAVAAVTPDMTGRDLASTVTTPVPYRLEASGVRRGSVVAFDFGIKRDILTQLSARGLEVTVVPAGTSSEEVIARRPDGVFLSNGPGDPEPLGAPIAAVAELLGRVPVFGICLGHQILGLALGARTFKLRFGHHGGNHPVRRIAGAERAGGVEITSQNHGFAVDLWSLAGGTAPAAKGLPGPDLLPRSVASAFGEVVPTHQNLNDGTLEGLACREVNARSVQFHPEGAPGPRDSTHLFDGFVEMMALPPAPRAA